MTLGRVGSKCSLLSSKSSTFHWTKVSQFSVLDDTTTAVSSPQGTTILPAAAFPQIPLHSQLPELHWLHLLASSRSLLHIVHDTATHNATNQPCSFQEAQKKVVNEIRHSVHTLYGYKHIIIVIVFLQRISERTCGREWTTQCHPRGLQRINLLAIITNWLLAPLFLLLLEDIRINRLKFIVSSHRYHRVYKLDDLNSRPDATNPQKKARDENNKQKSPLR